MIARLFPLLAALLLAGCPTPQDTADTADTGPTTVFTGPTITYAPPDALEEGQDVSLEVTATDSDGVTSVKAFYRIVGAPVWETLILDHGDGDTWTGTIPGDHVQPPGLQFYLRAQDGSDFQLATYLPADGQQGPFQVDIAATGLVVPFSEDFDTATGSLSLYSLGWDERSAAFQGYPWTVSNTRSNSGSWAVGHRQGVSGLPAMDDWLVSPPLDLTGLAASQVTWQEWGNDTAAANHQLWISTGSSDPADGDFVKVTDLDPPPEHAWGESQVVDLSPWADQPLVYLAWRYQGQFADDWWIDDVSVDTLKPDVRATAAVAAGTVHPGEQTTVTVTLENRSPEDEGAFTVSADAGSAGTVSTAQQVTSLAGNASTDLDFTLDVDGGFPDDTLLPFTVTVDDGDRVRAWDFDLVVGALPTATVKVTPGATELVQGWLGVGDPSDPMVEFPAFSQTISAAQAFDVDLTGSGAYLPPGPGDARWYLRVHATGDGSVDGLAIHDGGTDYTSADTGPWVADVDALYFLPRPPRPTLTAASADPTPAPGKTVTWTATLTNEGADTVGNTTLDVTTTDPNVTITGVSPSVLAADGWANGAEITVDVTLQIASTKVDSRPVPLRLAVTDDVETTQTTAFLAVPWPVLAATGVSVQDPTGNDDGILDPGESATVLVSVTNQGDLQAFDIGCTLSQVGGDATVDITDDQGSYGLIAAGDTDEDAYAVTVTSGAAGDSLEFALHCEDGNVPANLFDTGFTMVLGQQPWVRLSALDDPVGDSLGGDLDLVNGRYRSDGTTLDIVLRSATAFDPAHLLAESWMTQQGSDYVLYQAVVQGQPDGSGGYTLSTSLRGCDLYYLGYCYSFTRIGTPQATVLSPTEVQISLDLSQLGLVVNTLQAGFGAGFCGGDALYCDHLPDGWGNGVSGLNTDHFLTIDTSGPSR